MRINSKNQSRSEYFETQIARSRSKFSYCKVSCSHVRTWKKVITENHRAIDKIKGPILCLGTRNGREVDLFRCVFYQNVIINSFVRLLEARRYGWNSRFPFVESVGRSALVNIKEESVIGVEINPDAERPDVAIGSFDDMPSQWTDTFRILYSNSFDQSQDPYKTAKEWVRVCQGGGMVIIGFADAEPNVHDPVGNLTYRDFLELFPGQLLYFNKYGSNYSDIIIKIDKG